MMYQILLFLGGLYVEMNMNMNILYLELLSLWSAPLAFWGLYYVQALTY